MTKRKGSLTTKDRLEALAYIVAIVSGISAASLYFVNARTKSIEHTSAQLVRTWTNEGNITSTGVRFIDLKLENYDGDIIGSLTIPFLDSPLDVSVDGHNKGDGVH